MSEPSPKTLARGGGCPICRKPAAAPYKPFCSKRCADVDLARWLKGDYVRPASQNEEEDARPGRPANDGDEDG